MASKQKALIDLILAKFDQSIAAAQTDPIKVTAYINKAKALTAFHKYDDAINAADEAMNHKPSVAEAQSAKGVKSAAYVGWGDELYDQQNYPAALGLYRESAKALPTNSKGYIGASKALVALRNYEEAYKEVKEAQRYAVEPMDRKLAEDALFTACMGFGKTLLEENKNRDALRIFEEGEKLDATKAIVWINKSKALTALNRHSEAIQAAKHACELSDSAEMLQSANKILFNALFSKGLAYYEENRWESFEAALECFKKSIEVQRPTNEVYISIAKTLNKLERYDVALRYALEVSDSQDQSEIQLLKEIQAFAFSKKGDSAFIQEKYPEAQGLYSKAAELVPTNVDYLINKAKILNALIDYGNALKSYTEALKVIKAAMKHTRDPVEILSLKETQASIYSAQGDIESAQNHYTQAWKLYDKATISVPTNVDYLINKAKAQNADAQYDEAIATILSIAADGRAPTAGERQEAKLINAASLNGQGNRFKTHGQLERAKEKYEEAVIINPTDRQNLKDITRMIEDTVKAADLFKKGEDYFNQREYEKAALSFGRAKDKDPTYDSDFSALTLFNEGQKLLQKRNYDKALEKFKEAYRISQKPEYQLFENTTHNTIEELNEANEELAAGHYDVALVTYSRVFENNAKFFVARAAELLRSGSYKGAIEFANKALQSEPASVEAQKVAFESFRELIRDAINKQDHRIVTDYLTDAKSVLKKGADIAKLHESAAEAYNRYGEDCLEAKPSKAHDAFKKALGYHTDDVYKNNLGFAYIGLKQYEEALVCFKSIERGNPEHIEKASLGEKMVVAAKNIVQEEELLKLIKIGKVTEPENVMGYYDQLIKLQADTKKGLEYMVDKAQYHREKNGQYYRELTKKVEAALPWDEDNAIAKDYLARAEALSSFPDSDPVPEIYSLSSSEDLGSFPDSEAHAVTVAGGAAAAEE